MAKKIRLCLVRWMFVKYFLLSHRNTCLCSVWMHFCVAVFRFYVFFCFIICRPNVDDSVAALTEFRTQAIIVEYMIRNVDVFFDKNLASAAIAYYPEIQDVPLEAGTFCV